MWAREDLALRRKRITRGMGHGVLLLISQVLVKNSERTAGLAIVEMLHAETSIGYPALIPC